MASLNIQVPIRDLEGRKIVAIKVPAEQLRKVGAVVGDRLALAISNPESTSAQLCKMMNVARTLRTQVYHRVKVAGSVLGTSRIEFFSTVPGSELLGNFDKPGVEKYMIVYGARLEVLPQPPVATDATQAQWISGVMAALSTGVLSVELGANYTLSLSPIQVSNMLPKLANITVGDDTDWASWVAYSSYQRYAKFDRPIAVSRENKFKLILETLVPFPNWTGGGNPPDLWIAASILVRIFEGEDEFRKASATLNKILSAAKGAPAL